MGARVFGAMAAVGKSNLAAIGDVSAGTCTHTGGPAEGADAGAGSGHIAIAIATAKSSNKLAVVPVNVAANATPPDVAPLVGKDALHGLDGTTKYGQASELFVRSQDGIRFGVTTDMLSVKHGCEYVAVRRSLRCVTAPSSAEFFPGDLGSESQIKLHLIPQLPGTLR